MADEVAPDRGTVWQRPRLRDDGDRHRPVGWVELFFDLVFVVVVGVLAADLEHHPTGGGVLAFALQFVAVFWVWNGFTYYTERFESYGLESRLFVLFGVIGAAGLAVWGTDGLGDNYVGFALSYLVARGVNIVLWLRAAYHEPAFRPAAFSFATGFSIAALLMAIGAFVGEETRLVIWALAVVIDVGSPAVTNRFQSTLPPISRDKFPERFGLFTLIVLGETIVGIIRVVADVNAEDEGLTVLIAITAIVGLIVGFGMWWVYFDFVARRPPRPHFLTALVWVYFHIAALAGIVVVGAGVSLAIADDPLQAMPSSHRLLLTAGLGVTLLFFAALELTLDRDDDEPTHPLLSPAIKVASAVAVVVVGLAGDGLSPLVTLMCCAVVLAVCAGYGVFVWYGRAAADSGAQI